MPFIVCALCSSFAQRDELIVHIEGAAPQPQLRNLNVKNFC